MQETLLQKVDLSVSLLRRDTCGSILVKATTTGKSLHFGWSLTGSSTVEIFEKNMMLFYFLKYMF